MGSQTVGHTIEQLSHFPCPSLPPHCSGWSLGSSDALRLLAHPCLCPLRSSGPSVCLCLQVSVNGKRLDLTYSFLGSQGVGQCYDSSPCERQPCRHGATCMPAGEYEFQCLCRDGFKGGGAPGLGERGPTGPTTSKASGSKVSERERVGKCVRKGGAFVWAACVCVCKDESLRRCVEVRGSPCGVC